MDDLYWHSETYKRAIGADEWRSVFCCLVTNIGYFVWQSQSPVPRVRSRIAVCAFMICMGVVQYGWYWLAPRSFLKCRIRVRIFNRLVRSSLFLWMPWNIRSGIKSVGVLPYVHKRVVELSVNPSASLPLLAVKHLLMITGTTAHMSMAVHTTFSPTGQLAVHAANTLVHVSSHTAVAVFIMSSTPYAVIFHGMCSAFNLPLMLTQVDLENSVGINAHLDSSCHRHAVELLVLFVMLYGGLVLPVYLAARIDGHRRRLFRLEVQRKVGVSAPATEHEEEDEGMLLDEEGLPLPECAEHGMLCGALFDVAMALLLAVVTWGVVVHCREWIQMAVWPLEIVHHAAGGV